MSNDDFYTTNLPKEKTEEYLSLKEGHYLACLGKVEVRTRKDGIRQIHADHILIQRKGFDETPADKAFEYTIYAEKKLRLRQQKDGTYITNGVIYSPTFLLDFTNSTNKMKGFQTYRKRAFATYFSALNDETGEIDWTAISKRAGQLVSFEVVKNTYKAGDGTMKTNMDFAVDTYSLIPGSIIALEDLVAIYKEIDVSRAEKTRKDSEPVQAPVTPDDDLPF